MRDALLILIRLAGIGHLCVLVAAAIVPFKLDWKASLAPLSRLHRQMYMIYGGYVVMSIAAFALACLFLSRQLAADELLPRTACGYIAFFWGVRLSLQWVLDVKSYLTNRWFRLGYHALTVMFAYFVIVFALAALWPSAK